ncbi:MAG: hypothetical protein WBW92_06535 [Rhodanobacteraceae bacterium]
MSELLLALRNLCLLRIGPQDLPCSQGLLGTVLGLNLVLDTATGWLLGEPATALGTSLVSLVVVVGGIWLLLKMRDLQARFVQSALAVASAGLLFSVLAIPIQMAMAPLPAELDLLTDGQTLGMMLLAGLGGWSLAVMGHVLRHALERTFLTGLLLALALNLSAAALMQMLLPAGSGGA